jgi:hypothetical protein
MIILFIIWSLLDLGLTLLASTYSNGFQEANPITRYVIETYGHLGLTYFKLAHIIVISSTIYIFKLQSNKMLIKASYIIYVVWLFWWIVWGFTV